MRTLIITIAALALASCGAQPLRTTEEATADAVMDAASDADAIVASAEVKAAAADPEPAPAAEVQELTVLKDTLTGCEYVTSGNGLSPRMALASRTGVRYSYKHLGCNEG